MSRRLLVLILSLNVVTIDILAQGSRESLPIASTVGETTAGEHEGTGQENGGNRQSRRFEATKTLLEAVHRKQLLTGEPAKTQQLENAIAIWKRRVGASDTPDVNDLRLEAKNTFREDLRQERRRIWRERLYREAFACGIPLSELLDPVSKEDREVLARFCQDAAKHDDESESFKLRIDQVSALSDSEYKGEILARAWADCGEAEGTRAMLIANALRGVPSLRAASILGEVLRARTTLTESQEKAIVELLGCSLVEESVNPLLHVVKSSEYSSGVARVACYGLGRWLHRKDVRTVLEQRLLQDNPGQMDTLVSSFAETDNWHSLDMLVRQAKNARVRDRAMRALSIGYIKGERAEILWNVISDATLPEATRAAALRSSGDYFVRSSEARRRQIESWSQGAGIFAEAARSALEGNEEMIRRARVKLEQMKEEMKVKQSRRR